MPRRLAALAALFFLPACLPPDMIPPEARVPVETDPAFYAARQDSGRVLSAVDILTFDPALRRQRVGFETAEAPGTIIIDTANYHLYLVEGEGWAMRYGVAIGREGFGWTGVGTIRRRAGWPTWTPSSGKRHERPNDLCRIRWSGCARARRDVLVRTGCMNDSAPAGWGLCFERLMSVLKDGLR